MKNPVARVHWKQREGVGGGVGLGIRLFSPVKEVASDVAGMAYVGVRSRRGQKVAFAG